MAAKVSQLPAQLDAECVAGDPFSLSVTSSGATITSPTVTLKNALGATITGTVPTVSQVGAVTTVAFSSSTTAALNTDLTRPVSLLWSLSALVNGAGPFQLVARRLTIQPVGTAGVSSTSSATLAVTVGGAAVSLAVALGGVAGGVGAASDVTYSTRVTGDAFNRLEIQADGSILQGDGTTAPAPGVFSERFRIDGAAETMLRSEITGQQAVTMVNQRLVLSNFISPINKTVTQVQGSAWARQGVDQVQTLTMTGTPTGGTFTLTVNGQTTAPIAFNATAANVLSALTAIVSLRTIQLAGTTNVADSFTTAGGPFPGTPITVTFIRDLGSTTHPVMTANSASLTGGTTPTVTPTITTAAVGPTLAKACLYEFNANYDATLIAETAHIPYLFSGVFSGASGCASWTVPPTIQRGKMYGIGYLLNTTSTLPNLVGAGTGPDAAFVNLAPPLVVRLDGQTSLPATLTRAQTLNGASLGSRIWAYTI
jgi:hypothetical protein